MSEIWPLTVSKDRYTGVYSKGKWLAFCLEPDEVPDEPWDEDSVAMDFWWGENPYVIGKGDTMGEAVADLYTKHEGDHCKWCGVKL